MIMEIYNETKIVSVCESYFFLSHCSIQSHEIQTSVDTRWRGRPDVCNTRSHSYSEFSPNRQAIKGDCWEPSVGRSVISCVIPGKDSLKSTQCNYHYIPLIFHKILPRGESTRCGVKREKGGR